VKRIHEDINMIQVYTCTYDKRKLLTGWFFLKNFISPKNYLICPNEHLSERLLEDSGSQANFVQKPISAGALQESALFGYQAQKPKSATPLFFG